MTPPYRLGTDPSTDSLTPTPSTDSYVRTYPQTDRERDQVERDGFLLSNAHAREPHFSDDSVTIWHGDCLDVMREMPDASVDSIVTDPPYGLGFMGKAWDDLPPGLPWAQECLRVLKPGGHLLAFGGTRTWHRLAVAVEDAGFEVRDSIAWLYGSGFPKSLDVSKAIDRAAGATREVVGRRNRDLNWRGAEDPDSPRYAATRANVSPASEQGHISAHSRMADITAPATPDAARFQGWGTALKPAFEPVVVARKPLMGTVAANVLAHGTGALNVDGCRVPTDEDRRRNAAGGDNGLLGSATYRIRERRVEERPETSGRWPTNVVLDGDAAAELDEQSGTLKSGGTPPRRGADKDRVAYGSFAGNGEVEQVQPANEGGASRFFPVFRYEAKAPTAERPSYVQDGADGSVAGGPAMSGRRCNVCGNQTVPPGGKPWPACGHEDWERVLTENRAVNRVAHPTVKPLDLMRWLVRLVTPPGGTVLEPFAGSGTTAEACVIEGFRCIAIEREAAYLPLIVQRLSKPIQPDLFGGAA